MNIITFRNSWKTSYVLFKIFKRCQSSTLDIFIIIKNKRPLSSKYSPWWSMQKSFSVWRIASLTFSKFSKTQAWLKNSGNSKSGVSSGSQTNSDMTHTFSFPLIFLLIRTWRYSNTNYVPKMTHDLVEIRYWITRIWIHSETNKIMKIDYLLKSFFIAVVLISGVLGK